MARIRSVHPGLFTDESFMMASAHARLLIIGIWTEAWDDGVFEWKPITLKARLFPADNVDIGGILSELCKLNFVREFSVGPNKYGAVRNFRKWQKPKKPNSSHLLPDDLRTYVALNDDSSPPMGNQDGIGSENSRLMEDGGGRKDPSQEEQISTGRVLPMRGGLPA